MTEPGPVRGQSLDAPWPLASRSLPELRADDDGVGLRAAAVYSVRTGYRPLLVDLYYPPATLAPPPVVVWLHGGAFMHGDRTTLPPLLRKARLFSRLPLAGLAVAAIDYRLSGEATFPAQLADVKAAIRWLRARHDELEVDPTRIGLWGESAGAHLAALAGVTGHEAGGAADIYGDQTTEVAAVVDWYGPTDFALMDRQALAGSSIRHDSPDSPESRLLGGPVQERPELVALADPVQNATMTAPPFLIMHGTHDKLVPIGQSELLAKRLSTLGVPVVFRAVAGAGHLFEGIDDGHKLVDEVVDFLAGRLGAGR